MSHINSIITPLFRTKNNSKSASPPYCNISPQYISIFHLYNSTDFLICQQKYFFFAKFFWNATPFERSKITVHARWATVRARFYFFPGKYATLSPERSEVFYEEQRRKKAKLFYVERHQFPAGEGLGTDPLVLSPYGGDSGLTGAYPRHSHGAAQPGHSPSARGRKLRAPGAGDRPDVLGHTSLRGHKRGSSELR